MDDKDIMLACTAIAFASVFIRLKMLYSDKLSV